MCELLTANCFIIQYYRNYQFKTATTAHVCLSFKYGDAQFKTGGSPRESAWRCLTLPGRTAGGSPLQQTAPHSQAVSCGDSILPATGDERPFVLPTDHHLPLSAGPYPPVLRALWQAVSQGFNPFRTPGLFPFVQGQAPAAWWHPAIGYPCSPTAGLLKPQTLGPQDFPFAGPGLVLRGSP